MNKKVNNQIDVIMPIYNGEAFIAASVNSIMRQTLQTSRIIAINDGSTDRSLQIINALAQTHKNIKVIDCPHRGLSTSLNEALTHVSADYVAFLDCDDLWHPAKLAKQLRCLIEDPNLDMCFTQLTEFDDSSKTSRAHAARTGTMNGVGKSALLCRAAVFDKIGGFNESVEMGDFVEWFGRCQAKGIKHHTLPEVLTYRRVHDGNMSQSASPSDYLKLLREHLKRKAAAQTSD